MKRLAYLAASSGDAQAHRAAGSPVTTPIAR